MEGPSTHRVRAVSAMRLSRNLRPAAPAQQLSYHIPYNGILAVAAGLDDQAGSFRGYPPRLSLSLS